MKGSQMSSSAKRIQKELAEISLDPPCNCSAGPKGDNIYEWVSTIVGPGGKSDSSLRLCKVLAMGEAHVLSVPLPPHTQARHTRAAFSSSTSPSLMTTPSSRQR
jgi:hypothetical protein